MHTDILPFLAAALMATTAPNLQTAAGENFGDGAFQPQDMVTIHNVSNLDDGLNAKVIAFDPDAQLYVVSRRSQIKCEL